MSRAPHRQIGFVVRGRESVRVSTSKFKKSSGRDVTLTESVKTVKIILKRETYLLVIKSLPKILVGKSKQVFIK